MRAGRKSRGRRACQRRRMTMSDRRQMTCGHDGVVDVASRSRRDGRAVSRHPGVANGVGRDGPTPSIRRCRRVRRRSSSRSGRLAGSAATGVRRLSADGQNSSRTIGRTRLALLARRRSTTLKPARLNIRSVPWYALADGTRSPVGHVDRVRLEHRRTVVARVVDRRREQLAGDALPARLPPDDETHDRPDRHLVERREDLGIGQPLVVLARAEAHPADDRAVVVRDEPRRVVPPPRRGPEQLAVLGRGRVRPVAAAHPEVRAPAPLRVATLVEQRRQVADAFRGERLDLERHGDRW